MFGCPAAEAIGQPLERFIPERFRAAHAGHVQTFGEAGVTRRMMGRLIALLRCGPTAKSSRWRRRSPSARSTAAKSSPSSSATSPSGRRLSKCWLPPRLAPSERKEAAEHAIAPGPFPGGAQPRAAHPADARGDGCSDAPGPNGPLRRAVRETLEMIGRSVEMEARLIDDLLDVSRIPRKGRSNCARSGWTSARSSGRPPKFANLTSRPADWNSAWTRGRLRLMGRSRRLQAPAGLLELIEERHQVHAARWSRGHSLPAGAGPSARGSQR